MSDEGRYEKRGVSASKKEVHQAIKNLSKGLYPNAFCKIIPDIVSEDSSFCNVMHADTAGTKTALAYIYWKETGDLSVWEGIAQDAIVMNVDDMACVGVTDHIVLSSTIGRNSHVIPGEVIERLIQSSTAFIEKMRQYDVHIHSSGGETADVGDIVRTIDVGYTAFARMKRSQIVINDIQPGQCIVGFSSYGQSLYETEYNSGIGSNGLTSARHDVLDNVYIEKYPESFNPYTEQKYIYSGDKQLTDTFSVGGELYSVGKLLLSPTRTYLPLLKKILDEYKVHIKGIIHNTGGAHTKCMNFMQNCHVIKDNLLPVPPLFELIQTLSGTSDREMYQVFNMGTRLEIYTDEHTAHALIDMAHSFAIEAQVIGRVEKEKGNAVTIHSKDNIVTYGT